MQIVQFIYVSSHCLHSADPGPGEDTTKSELMGLGSPAPCPGTQITHHTGFATFVPIFHEICSTYSFTAVHLLKRIFGTNILEICIHISVLCRCIHTKGYWMHTYTKYAPIYPPLRMYSYEVCLEQTYSKYAHTYTNCVLNRIIEHQVQMSLDIYCLFRIFYVPLHVSQVCPG